MYYLHCVYFFKPNKKSEKKEFDWLSFTNWLQ